MPEKVTAAASTDNPWAGRLVFAILAAAMVVPTRGRLSFNRDVMERVSGVG
jgi:hypothetical protein